MDACRPRGQDGAGLWGDTPMPPLSAESGPQELRDAMRQTPTPLKGAGGFRRRRVHSPGLCTPHEASGMFPCGRSVAEG